ncbi:MAG: GNAT family N-acetyltransferase [Bacteroidota bacterium]
MKIEILPCQTQHLDSVLTLAAATEEIADFEGEAYSFFSRERLEIMAISPDVLFLVAEVEGSFAGFFILLMQRAAGMGYIVDMAVAKKFHRCGICRKFIEAGLEFATKEGCSEIWCIVHEQNEAAWRLFEQAGFRRGRKFFFVGKMLD